MKLVHITYQQPTKFGQTEMISQTLEFSGNELADLGAYAEEKWNFGTNEQRNGEYYSVIVLLWEMVQESDNGHCTKTWYSEDNDYGDTFVITWYSIR